MEIESSFMEFGAWNVDACRAASVERSGAWEIKKWTTLDCILDVKIDSCRYQGDFAVKLCLKIFANTLQREALMRLMFKEQKCASIFRESEEDA